MFDQSKGSARSWIVQMTYHRAIDRRRYLQSRHFYTCTDVNSVNEILPNTGIEATRYEQTCEAILGRSLAEQIFSSLSENQRETIRLFFFEGYTMDEIAQKLGQSVGNVRNHYYRALDRMRELLAKRGSKVR